MRHRAAGIIPAAFVLSDYFIKDEIYEISWERHGAMHTSVIHGRSLPFFQRFLWLHLGQVMPVLLPGIALMLKNIGTRLKQVPMNVTNRMSGILFRAVVVVMLMTSMAAHSSVTPDSISIDSADLTKEYQFNYRKLLAPAGLIAAGAAGICAFTGFKHSLASDFANLRKNGTSRNYCV